MLFPTEVRVPVLYVLADGGHTSLPRVHLIPVGTSGLKTACGRLDDGRPRLVPHGRVLCCADCHAWLWTQGAVPK